MSSTGVEPERQSLSIVVLGEFNPAIFQPLWFSANGLLPPEETEAADITLVHKEIASFSIASIQFQVDNSKFGLTTIEPPQAPTLRDLASGTLSILEHTPLRAIGLNLDLVFKMDSDDDWNAVGDQLVPKERWSKLLDRPGMRQVVVEGKRPDCIADRIHFRVQPSGARSVLVAINQHYQLDTDERSDVRERHSEAIRVLNDDWTSFMNYAREAAPKLLEPDHPGKETGSPL